MTKLDQDLNQEIYHDRDGVDLDKAKDCAQDDGPLVKNHEGSKDKSYINLRVNMRLAYVKAFFIHPDNNSYPLASAVLKTTLLNFEQKSDYAKIDLKVENLQLFDCTSYPNTLNPKLEYMKEDQIIENEIAGLNPEAKEVSSDGMMLTLTCYVFQFPLEDQC